MLIFRFLGKKRLTLQFHEFMCMQIYQEMPYAIVRLPHPRSEGSQGQETFFAHPLLTTKPAIRNYDTECSNHHPSQSP